MRKRIVDVSCGDGGVTGADSNLVKVGNDIADRVKPVDRGLLMRIDFKAAVIVMADAEPPTQLRANVAAQDRVNYVTDLLRSIAH